jgi:hypothetical protein
MGSGIQKSYIGAIASLKQTQEEVLVPAINKLTKLLEGNGTREGVLPRLQAVESIAEDYSKCKDDLKGKVQNHEDYIEAHKDDEKERKKFWRSAAWAIAMVVISNIIVIIISLARVGATK